MREVTVWDEFATVVAVDRLLLGPEAAWLLCRALDREIAVQRRDGIVSSRVSGLRDQLAAVGGNVLRRSDVLDRQACGGHARRPPLDDPEDLGYSVDPSEAVPVEEPIGTADAAKMLGLTRRQTTRLARSGALGLCRMVRGRLILSSEDVAAVAAERNQAR
jgi:hypothetical protein